MTTQKRIYIAGPMTGIADFNYPAFNAEAYRLRALGYRVENPAENVHPDGQSWEGYMRVALRQMLTCDEIAVLPGWASSKGAMLEISIAIDLGIAHRPARVYVGCGDEIIQACGVL